MNENKLTDSFSMISRLDKEWPNVPRKKAEKLNLKMTFRPSGGIHGPTGSDDSTRISSEHTGPSGP